MYHGRGSDGLVHTPPVGARPAVRTPGAAPPSGRDAAPSSVSAIVQWGRALVDSNKRQNPVPTPFRPAAAVPPVRPPTPSTRPESSTPLARPQPERQQIVVTPGLAPPSAYPASAASVAARDRGTPHATPTPYGTPSGTPLRRASPPHAPVQVGLMDASQSSALRSFGAEHTVVAPHTTAITGDLTRAQQNEPPLHGGPGSAPHVDHTAPASPDGQLPAVPQAQPQPQSMPFTPSDPQAPVQQRPRREQGGASPEATTPLTLLLDQFPAADGSRAPSQASAPASAPASYTYDPRPGPTAVLASVDHSRGTSVSLEPTAQTAALLQGQQEQQRAAFERREAELLALLAQVGGDDPDAAPVAVVESRGPEAVLEERLWELCQAAEEADKEEALAGRALAAMTDSVARSEVAFAAARDDLVAAVDAAAAVAAVAQQLQHSAAVALETFEEDDAASAAWPAVVPERPVLTSEAVAAVPVAEQPAFAVGAVQEALARCEAALEAARAMGQAVVDGTARRVQALRRQQDEQAIVVDDAHQTLASLSAARDDAAAALETALADKASAERRATAAREASDARDRTLASRRDAADRAAALATEEELAVADAAEAAAQAEALLQQRGEAIAGLKARAAAAEDRRRAAQERVAEAAAQHRAGARQEQAAEDDADAALRRGDEAREAKAAAEERVVAARARVMQARDAATAGRAAVRDAERGADSLEAAAAAAERRVAQLQESLRATAQEATAADAELQAAADDAAEAERCCRATVEERQQAEADAALVEAAVLSHRDAARGADAASTLRRQRLQPSVLDTTLEEPPTPSPMPEAPPPQPTAVDAPVMLGSPGEPRVALPEPSLPTAPPAAAAAVDHSADVAPVSRSRSHSHVADVVVDPTVVVEPVRVARWSRSVSAPDAVWDEGPSPVPAAPAAHRDPSVDVPPPAPPRAPIDADLQPRLYRRAQLLPSMSGTMSAVSSAAPAPPPTGDPSNPWHFPVATPVPHDAGPQRPPPQTTPMAAAGLPVSLFGGPGEEKEELLRAPSGAESSVYSAPSDAAPSSAQPPLGLAAPPPLGAPIRADGAHHGSRRSSIQGVSDRLSALLARRDARRSASAATSGASGVM